MAEALDAADLSFDNGWQEPLAEAELLVAHVLGLTLDELDARLGEAPDAAADARVQALLSQRIDERIPMPYLLQQAWFAGRSYYIDERVLIPRSRIENILDDDEGFLALTHGRKPRRILDLCTGSGCLAIALAHAFPEAQVDALDISAGALQVTRINCERHGVGERVQVMASNLFQAAHRACYDLIVTNPPYVPTAVYAGLPAEFKREPAIALEAGADGLWLVEPILRQAPDYLTEGGVLVCEVGDDVEEIMRARWPDAPLEWLMFHFGGSGVFAVWREQLARWNSL
ncbi:putative N5-glutamine S-adenosyl-L-methionine-dependent methyltransferase [Magnetofaba australis IT-1]|uniref:Putative N5-glutamine S-adenosyl-L-methionine-dependent methyltransferase n=1 Tax=Magnetofaba australis IT-1 TaxID=1434232 RepID=A0A1Y2K0P9_9PROT|nr:putative N5-glutamine S-adenosyl-L-methionine-dependent methyltransferase [Magnetofaba australis IT-1]